MFTKCLASFFLAFLVCSVIANGYFLLRECQGEASDLNAVVGKMVRASLRFPPSGVTKSVGEIKEPSLEDVFSSLGQHDWRSMNEKEKLELAIVALFYCDMQGGDLISLKRLLDGDEAGIVNIIATLSEEEINKVTGWNDKKRSSFRSQMAFLMKKPSR